MNRDDVISAFKGMHKARGNDAQTSPISNRPYHYELYIDSSYIKDISLADMIDEVVAFNEWIAKTQVQP